MSYLRTCPNFTLTKSNQIAQLDQHVNTLLANVGDQPLAFKQKKPLRISPEGSEQGRRVVVGRKQPPRFRLSLL